jgi:ATP-dependent exoDNAse (exonuclease V) beta subunit
MKNKPKKETEKNKKHLTPEQEEQERMDLLRRAAESPGKQLQFDTFKNELKEVDELRELIGTQFENPEEKYQAYYNGMRKVLMQYLPSGKDFKQARDIIYDEKNVFLNLGKKKSDNNGVRGSDGRMTYQPVMNEMVDIIVNWASTSQNPFTLYNALYELNEKHGYGHEVYDDSARNFANAMRKLKDTEL